jgi:glycosyltransferase involved in cell wall biosynthesis
MPPLRIAFINPSGDIGGAERSLLLLLERLDRARYAAEVVCGFEGRLLEALAAIDVPATVVPLGAAEQFSRFAGRADRRRSLSATLGIGGAVYGLRRHLSAVRPDLIHTNGLKAHLIGGLCGRLLRRPVVWHVRDLVPDGRLLAAFQSAAGWLPHRLIAISQVVAAQFAGHRAVSRTRIIHNAVDAQQFRPSRSAEEVRAELGIAPHTLVVAMVAHFTRWKGHHLFLDVIARLARQGLPVAGLIVGTSIYRSAGHEEYEAEVRATCRDLGLAGAMPAVSSRVVPPRVHFTGYQSCVADFLNAADVLVHPPTLPEPFGRVVIEAMALAKPVVAAAAGGVLEIVEAGVTGLLVPPGDAEGFAAAVGSLLCHPEQRVAMGQQGRERVAQRFAPEFHVAQVECVYRELAPSAHQEERRA